MKKTSSCELEDNVKAPPLFNKEKLLEDIDALEEEECLDEYFEYDEGVTVAID